MNLDPSIEKYYLITFQTRTKTADSHSGFPIIKSYTSKVVDDAQFAEAINRFTNNIRSEEELWAISCMWSTEDFTDYWASLYNDRSLSWREKKNLLRKSQFTIKHQQLFSHPDRAVVWNDHQYRREHSNSASRGE